MTTEKQIEANRKNAKLGGVKTKEGRAISSRNATKFGFFSDLVIKEDKLNHKDFCEEMYGLFSPKNIYESQMLELMLSNMLAYRRICQVESILLRKGMDDVLSDEDQLWAINNKPDYQIKFNDYLMDELLKFQKYKTTCANLIIRSRKELEMGSFCNEPPLDV